MKLTISLYRLMPSSPRGKVGCISLKRRSKALHNVMLSLGILVVCTLLAVYLTVKIFFFLRRRLCKQGLHCHSDDAVIAFFHPYCASGGGGERVLWVGIKALFDRGTQYKHLAIYSGDDGLSKQSILDHVKDRFGIEFTTEEAARIHIVTIQSRTLLEAKWYPVGTMLFQSLASLLVGLECILRFPPDVFCDTMGAAFTYPVAYYLANATVVAYVHYPIISTDMLKKVREQRPSYNNASLIASSVTVSSIKLLYYQLFARAYSWAGTHAKVVMVNSSWTRGHVAELWWQGDAVSIASAAVGAHRGGGQGRRLALVYPPCNTTQLLAMKGTQGQAASATKKTPGKKDNKRIILSIGQFRPEKDHMLQIRAMKALLEMDERRYADVELVIMGSTRHADDVALLESLKAEVTRLDLNENVRFVANGAYSELQAYMQKALIGVHTMWNEHFGISVVEMMAAGLVVVAHNSGGPRLDIIGHASGDAALANGYLAEKPEEYAAVFAQVLDGYAAQRALQERARASVTRFSDEVFGQKFVAELEAAVR